MIGINHKTATLNLREELSRTCQKRFSPENSIHSENAFVLLSTCNRTEIYFSAEDLAKTHSYILSILKAEIYHDEEAEFDQKLYSYFGEECFLHLCEVTAGLDSAIIAETEIQGQVKSSYELACKFVTLPSPVHYLFQKALKIGKEIRSKMDLGRGLEGIEHAIYQTAEQVFDNPMETKILLVGASLINEKVLTYLKKKNCQNITLCNRSDEKAALLQEAFQVPLLPWENLSLWPSYDWIIVGTRAPRYLLEKKDLMVPLSSIKLINDLSVPRNADPLLTEDLNLRLLNIDQINRLLRVRRQKLTEKVALAKNYIQMSTQKQIHLFQKRHERVLSLSEVA